MERRFLGVLQVPRQCGHQQTVPDTFATSGLVYRSLPAGALKLGADVSSSVRRCLLLPGAFVRPFSHTAGSTRGSTRVAGAHGELFSIDRAAAGAHPSYRVGRAKCCSLPEEALTIELGVGEGDVGV